ncbi:MAG: MFS transporter, partial [Burkholderiales bacterium]|nr:MFS transporter [Burkholderiales bacterium]
MKDFSPTVIRLLLSSFVCIMGRSAALPFMALYLTQAMQWDQQTVGWVLGGSLFGSTLLGLYGGFLSDHFDKRRLMMLSCFLISISAVLVTFTSYLLLVCFFLVMIDTALTVRSVALKALLAELLTVEKRTSAFSMNYTLINVAFSIGPLLSAVAFAYNHAAPLWMCAMFALMATPLLKNGDKAIATDTHSVAAGVDEQRVTKPNFAQTLIDLKNDKRLVFFTLGSVLTQIVFGRFVSGYISLYLIATKGVQAAANLVPYLLITNAICVVLFQYPVGCLLRQNRLFRSVSLGAILYALGIVGFMFSESALTWIIATIIFTIGEVIVIPSEYMFIDMIAPADKRGSYYAVQSLSVFGAALNPIICAFLLSHYSGKVMFSFLICAALMAIGMYR